jgi:hypothetical protein
MKNTIVEDSKETPRILKFEEDTVVYDGNISNQIYWFKIKADIIDDKGVIQQGKKIDFRYDRNCEDEFEVCSQFKYKEHNFIYGEYPANLQNIRNQIKKLIPPSIS